MVRRISADERIEAEPNNHQRTAKALECRSRCAFRRKGSRHPQSGNRYTNMRPPELLPWLTASDTAVTITDWSVTIGGKASTSLKSLPATLPAWDVTQTLEIEAVVQLDPHSIASSCQLLKDDRLRLSMSWYSFGTGLLGKSDDVDLRSSERCKTTTLLASLP